MSDETEAIYAYRTLLVGEGRECDHPPQFRHPIPGHHSNDPNEWACGVCDLWQVRDPDQGKGEPR